MKKYKFFLIVTGLLVSGFFTTTYLLAQTYQYDSAGRLSDVVYDDGRFIHYSYDKNGNMTNKSSNVVAMFSDGFE